MAGSGASVRSASKRVAASACAQHGALVGGVGVGGDGGEGHAGRAEVAHAVGEGEDLVEVGGVGGEGVAERRAQGGHAAQVEQARVGQRRAEHGGQHLLLAFDAAAPGGGVACDGRGPGEVGGLARVEADRARGRDDRAERRVDHRPRRAEPHAGERVDGVAEAGEVQPDVAGDRQAGQLLHGAGGAAGAAEVERAGELRAGLCGHGVAGVGRRRGVVALAGGPGDLEVGGDGEHGHRRRCQRGCGRRRRCRAGPWRRVSRPGRWRRAARSRRRSGRTRRRWRRTRDRARRPTAPPPPSQRCAPQPTPAAMTINAVTATAATRSRFGRRLTRCVVGASAGSSRVAPSVRPACAAVRRVRVSSIRLTRVVASTAASSAVGVPLVVPVRSAVRSPRGRSRACVRSPAARSLPCARPTGSAERGLPCRPVVACVRSPDSADEPGLRRRPFVACVRSLAAARRTCAREADGLRALVGCGVGPGPALARADGLRALSRRRIEVRPVRGPVRAVRPAARLRRGAWPALASSLRPFARCGVGSEPALAPADGLRSVARICGGVWLAASGRRLRAPRPLRRRSPASSRACHRRASGRAARRRSVARAHVRLPPAHPAPRRSRVPAASPAACRSGGRPVPLWSRARCTPAVRPSAVGACSSVRRLLRRVPGRQSSRLRGLAVRPRRGPTVRPRRCPSARRRRCGRPAVRPELSSLVRPVPRRRRAAVHLGVGQADRSGRAPEADCSSAASDGRQAGGPVPVLVPPAFPGRSRGLPAHPAARIPVLEGLVSEIPVRRRPICRIPGPVGPVRRVVARVRCVCSIPAPRGLGGRIATAGPSRPWAARADRPGAAAALAPSTRSAARRPDRCRLPPRVARLPPPQDGAPRDRPGAGWRRSARAGRGRRRCPGGGDARRGRSGPSATPPPPAARDRGRVRSPRSRSRPL